jgi:putative CocE/NonD family hydrolase
MAPKKYFTDDQRFLNEREDVLSWTSEPLEEDLTVLGEIKALIEFATDHEDADLYVKVIDVYPEDRADEETDLEGINYKGYQRLVRLGYIRGRYRESFEAGKPFVSGEKTSVQVPLLDVFHTFKKGHRIMVQIQSSMFPLFDLNPQKYVEDIYQAEKGDFEKAKHSIYQDSKIILPIMEL